jgi:hypothetical protein
MSLLPVGICGRSCSGKGAVTEGLASLNRDVLLIQADWYFYRSQNCVYSGYTCLEHTNSVDSHRLAGDLRSMIGGRSTSIHVETPWLPQVSIDISRDDLRHKRIILVDGFLTFAVKELVDLFDQKIFIDACDHCILSRRLRRDGFGGSAYIRDVVIPVSKEYDLLQKGNCDVIVDGCKPKDKVMEVVGSFLKKVPGFKASLPPDGSPWEVHFGDLVQDTAWHPISFGNLKEWVKKKRDPLDHGEELKGNTFRYRKDFSSGEYEVRLSSQYRLGVCRYTLEESRQWK